MELTPSAPKYKTSKPDVGKTARAVEDALTGIAWVDDSQVVTSIAGKIWSVDGAEGCAVLIAAMDDPHDVSRCLDWIGDKVKT